MTRLSTLSRSVDGRVAIVTGAASGMGRATAHLLADEGAHVAVVDHTPGGADQVAAEITAAGGTARAWDVDVTDPAAVDAAVTAVHGELGAIDILVNNAGISVPTALDGDGFDEAWAATIAVNLTAHTTWIRACLADLRREGAGRIVNVASTEGLERPPTSARTRPASTAWWG